jgi:hypothetical protein
MINELFLLEEKLMLRKRSLIATVNDQLKYISQLADSRHRSVINFIVNVIATLIAYTWQPKKPSLRFDDNEIQTLAVYLS